MLRFQKWYVSVKAVIENAKTIVCLALLKMHLYISVNHIHL